MLEQVHLAQFLEFSDWEAMGSTAGWSFVGHAVRMGSSVRVSFVSVNVFHLCSYSHNNRLDYVGLYLLSIVVLRSNNGFNMA